MTIHLKVPELEIGPVQVYNYLRQNGSLTVNELWLQAWGRPYDDTEVTLYTGFSRMDDHIRRGIKIGLIDETYGENTHDFAKCRLSPSPTAQRLFNGLGFSFTQLSKLRGDPMIVDLT